MNAAAYAAYDQHDKIKPSRRVEAGGSCSKNCENKQANMRRTNGCM